MMLEYPDLPARDQEQQRCHRFLHRADGEKWLYPDRNVRQNVQPVVYPTTIGPTS